MGVLRVSWYIELSTCSVRGFVTEEHCDLFALQAILVASVCEFLGKTTPTHEPDNDI